MDSPLFIEQSSQDRRSNLLQAIINFRGGGVEELYEILRMLSMANTGNRGEVYSLYRLSKWLDIRWVGHQLGAHDLEVIHPTTGHVLRIQVKAADPEKAWKRRWAFKSLWGGRNPKPYDFLLLMGKRAEDTQEEYLEKEGEYAVFLVQYAEINNRYFSSNDRIDLTWAKSDLFTKTTTGQKFRDFYERFETTYQRAAIRLLDTPTDTCASETRSQEAPAIRNNKY